MYYNRQRQKKVSLSDYRSEAALSSRVGTAGAAGYYATYYYIIIDDSRDQGQKVLIYFGGPSPVFFLLPL